ncbi:FAD-dependent monooxygenase [Amycolatopsis nigrescens]|uniref:FAD-dependent monooxygenase n=1 Tax=Amycolatopsis nigrescens TaxID=381445 RepID=UPI0003709D23|nr:FAD-dependent monooxygenase [Amycolatopsis nigrescens]
MDADVIVVGAGPVGLLLAAELRLGGAHPVVVERLGEPAAQTKARGIGPLATEALRRRGLGPQLDEAHHGGARDFARDHGSTLGHFANIHKLIPDQQRRSTLIWQPELERVLTAHAELLGVPILRGHEVVELESDVDGVAVVAKAPQGERRLRAPYVVGCDGGRSTVRKLAGFHFPGTPPLLRTIAGRVRFAGDVPAAGRYATGTFMCGGSMAGVSELALAEEPRSPVTAGELADAIRRVTGADVGIEELHDDRRAGDQARQVDTYRRGRVLVLLAGDAAHVHSPSGGQGLNLGLLDAVNLGWKLAAFVCGDAPEALLDTYTRERHPAGEAVLRNTRAQSALLAPGPHVDALREIIEELLDIPAANRYFTELLSAVNLRYEFPYPAQDPVGQHCPDLELRDDEGKPSRLSDHTRSGRGLLLLTPQTRELARYATSQIEVVPVTNTDPLLLRPDAVVAWASSNHDSLKVALETWFGPPAFTSARSAHAPRHAASWTPWPAT